MTQTKRQRDQEKRLAISRAMEWSEWLALNQPGLLDEDAFQSYTDYFLDLHWRQIERPIELICEEVGFIDMKSKGGPLILAEIIRMAVALGAHIEVMTDDPEPDIEKTVRFYACEETENRGDTSTDTNGSDAV
jgi:hypothetical protein